ncbi:MAG: pyruvate ferredoxin oxidoreductase [Desulfurococcaceae archaeon]|nr:pyruvate ferredoxin oxidoreductase [Desulfurococcaceae archaeon]
MPIRIWDIPREEYFVSGHRLCPGCGAGIIMRHLAKALGGKGIIAHATGCVEVSTTYYPETSWRVPWIHVAFENAAAVASGIEAAYKVLKRKGIVDPNKDVKIVAVGGDGGTFDIGFQALSGMLERGHDVLYLVYDNEAYMNTGIQRSGSTPFGAWTTTTPVGDVWRYGEWRPKTRKDLLFIAMAHNIPYYATVNPAYITDLYEKISKALTIKGPKLIHAFSPCPPGWRINDNDTIRVSRLAVQTGVWINLEYENGVVRVTTPVPRRRPVEEYLKIQGRFRHLDKEAIEKIQAIVDEYVAKINKLVGKEVIGPVER